MTEPAGPRLWDSDATSPQLRSRAQTAVLRDGGYSEGQPVDPRRAHPSVPGQGHLRQDSDPESLQSQSHTRPLKSSTPVRTHQEFEGEREGGRGAGKLGP